MISGECSVETLPFGDVPNSPGGRKLAIDGLRLRLDLRIVPSAAGSGDAAAAAAIWRIENARLATLPLGIPYRALAVMSGLGAMLLALGMWFVSGPTATRDVAEPPAADRFDSATAPRSRPAPSRLTPSRPAPNVASSPEFAAPANAAAAGDFPSAPGSVAPPESGFSRAGASSSGVPAASGPASVSPAASAAAPSPSASPHEVLPSASPSPASAAGVAPRIAPVRDNTTPAVRAAAGPGTSSASTSSAGTSSASTSSAGPSVRAGRGEAQPARPGPGQPGRLRAATSPASAGGPAPEQAPALTPPARSARGSARSAANTPPRSDSTNDDMLDLFGDPK